MFIYKYMHFLKFHFSLYHTMAKEKDTENIIISPVVVASSLGLVALGGKASTASQVKTVLSADKLKDEHLHAGLSELLTEVRSFPCFIIPPSSPQAIDSELSLYHKLMAYMCHFFSGEQRQDTQHHLENQQPPLRPQLCVLR